MADQQAIQVGSWEDLAEGYWNRLSDKKKTDPSLDAARRFFRENYIDEEGKLKKTASQEEFARTMHDKFPETFPYEEKDEKGNLVWRLDPNLVKQTVEQGPAGPQAAKAEKAAEGPPLLREAWEWTKGKLFTPFPKQVTGISIGERMGELREKGYKGLEEFQKAYKKKYGKEAPSSIELAKWIMNLTPGWGVGPQAAEEQIDIYTTPANILAMIPPVGAARALAALPKLARIAPWAIRGINLTTLAGIGEQGLKDLDDVLSNPTQEKLGRLSKDVLPIALMILSRMWSRRLPTARTQPQEGRPPAAAGEPGAPGGPGGPGAAPAPTPIRPTPEGPAPQAEPIAAMPRPSPEAAAPAESPQIGKARQNVAIARTAVERQANDIRAVEDQIQKRESDLLTATADEATKINRELDGSKGKKGQVTKEGLRQKRDRLQRRLDELKGNLGNAEATLTGIQHAEGFGRQPTMTEQMGAVAAAAEPAAPEAAPPTGPTVIHSGGAGAPPRAEGPQVAAAGAAPPGKATVTLEQEAPSLIVQMKDLLAEMERRAAEQKTPTAAAPRAAERPPVEAPRPAAGAPETAKPAAAPTRRGGRKAAKPPAAPPPAAAPPAAGKPLVAAPVPVQPPPAAPPAAAAAAIPEAKQTEIRNATGASPSQLQDFMGMRPEQLREAWYNNRQLNRPNIMQAIEMVADARGIPVKGKAQAGAEAPGATPAAAAPAAAPEPTYAEAMKPIVERARKAITDPQQAERFVNTLFRMKPEDLTKQFQSINPDKAIDPIYRAVFAARGIQIPRGLRGGRREQVAAARQAQAPLPPEKEQAAAAEEPAPDLPPRLRPESPEAMAEVGLPERLAYADPLAPGQADFRPRIDLYESLLKHNFEDLEKMQGEAQGNLKNAIGKVMAVKREAQKIVDSSQFSDAGLIEKWMDWPLTRLRDLFNKSLAKAAEKKQSPADVPAIKALDSIIGLREKTIARERAKAGAAAPAPIPPPEALAGAAAEAEKPPKPRVKTPRARAEKRQQAKRKQPATYRTLGEEARRREEANREQLAALKPPSQAQTQRVTTKEPPADWKFTGSYRNEADIFEGTGPDGRPRDFAYVKGRFPEDPPIEISADKELGPNIQEVIDATMRRAIQRSEAERAKEAGIDYGRIKAEEKPTPAVEIKASEAPPAVRAPEPALEPQPETVEKPPAEAERTLQGRPGGRGKRRARKTVPKK